MVNVNPNYIQQHKTKTRKKQYILLITYYLTHMKKESKIFSDIIEELL